eukprot:scaffold50292_cov63-Phaeocystis_antarctica.AAC.1
MHARRGGVCVDRRRIAGGQRRGAPHAYEQRRHVEHRCLAQRGQPLAAPCELARGDVLAEQIVHQIAEEHRHPARARAVGCGCWRLRAGGGIRVARNSRVGSRDEVFELLDAHAAGASQARALLRWTILAALSAEGVLEVEGQHEEEEEAERPGDQDRNHNRDRRALLGIESQQEDRRQDGDDKGDLPHLPAERVRS